MSDQSQFRIVVLAGGTSAEREVSLGSGRASAVALSRLWPTRLIDVDKPGLSEGLDPSRDVVFSTLHGTFGEDGGMQKLLDQAGVEYAGCDVASSELTFDKQTTKEFLAKSHGIKVPMGIVFEGGEKPTAANLIGKLGELIVIKPNCGGSSVGLSICANRGEVEAALAGISAGTWLAEQRITGREVTVGILHGRALPVVEIAPKSGVFDYEAKYTKGLTAYLAPAPIEPELAAKLQNEAEIAYVATGCRDYARIDFMITEKNERFLLEINTLPGMKETSLLPMGARCAGMDFTTLVGELVSPAISRLSTRLGNGGVA
ncbi:MAG: D-alanine--D-alanine ligase [Opitutaceae bacterium]|jgi:D-alanine-D-alanine ligase|nr:D-alanine--D-alanine ligase [Opitutaceae bacterium]